MLLLLEADELFIADNGYQLHRIMLMNRRREPTLLFVLGIRTLTKELRILILLVTFINPCKGRGRVEGGDEWTFKEYI